jgi:hypothetical protein
MDYPFVSILPIVDEVQNELKTIVKSSSFSEDDIYSWLVQASRLIGVPSYGSTDAFLKVQKYTTILPKSFYLLEDIKLAFLDPMIIYDYRDNIKLFAHVMRPADTATRRHCANTYNIATQTTLTYTLKVPPGIGKFSFESGVVWIKFQEMQKDTEGNVLIMDEENTLKALKCYATIMLLKEMYINGEIARYVYKDMEEDWIKYSDMAKVILKFPSMADNDFLLAKQEARYRKMRYKEQ